MTTPTPRGGEATSDEVSPAELRRRLGLDRPPSADPPREAVDAWIDWGRHPWWWQLVHRRPREAR